MATDGVDLKGKHDALLAGMPEGASHDSETCAFCAMDLNEPTQTTGGQSVKTYTEEELAAAIAVAVASLESQVAELQKTDAEEELAAKIAEAKAPLEAAAAELTTKLEDAQLRAETAEKAHADLVAYLDAEAAAATEAEAAAARKDERIAVVKAAATVSDEFVAQHADRWATLSDEEFDERVATMREIASATAPAAASTPLPAATALQTARETNGAETSAAKTLIGLRLEGIDARSIRETTGV